jgi:hypothetical protein
VLAAIAAMPDIMARLAFWQTLPHNGGGQPGNPSKEFMHV